MFRVNEVCKPLMEYSIIYVSYLPTDNKINLATPIILKIVVTEFEIIVQ